MKMDARSEAFKYSGPSVAVALAPSRRAAACIALACLATLVLLAMTPLEPALEALALAWSGVAALAALRRIAWHRGREGVRAFRIGEGGAIEVEDGAQGLVRGEVRAGCLVAPWLTIVRWQPEGSRLTRAIVVLPDMVDRESFRALRVALRWAPAAR